MIRCIRCIVVLAALLSASLVSVSSAQAAAPVIFDFTPVPGPVSDLTEVAVFFSENVGGVDAGDLLINGIPATSVRNSFDLEFTFTVPRLTLVGGVAHVTWAASHGITNAAGELFDSTAPSATATYVLAPVIIDVAPPAGPVADLTQIAVQFSEPVGGVEASDLLINSVSAQSVSNYNPIFVFYFPRPAPNGGPVQMTWSVLNGITNAAGRPFSGGLSTATRTYTLPDIASPIVTELRPGPGSTVRPLGEIRVTFSEGVTNVNATDLLLNGRPATNVIRQSSSNYLFQFVLARPGIARAAWSTGQAIIDLAPEPHSFSGGEPWSYFVDKPLYSILVNPNNNRVDVLFSNKFFNGVCTVENLEGKLWVPLVNFFTTQRVGQVTVTLPTNNYSQLRLRCLDVSPGNSPTHLANAYGNIHTVAGLGEVPPGTNAWRTNYEGKLATEVNLSNPREAVVDADGNIYVVEKDGHAVDKIDTRGFIHTVLGTHEPGTTGIDNRPELQPTLSPLNQPTGLWLNRNLLYVLDSGNKRVRVLDLLGLSVQTVLLDSSLVDGGALWVAPNGGEAYFTDGTVLKHWERETDVGVTVLATGFGDLTDVTVNPSGQIIAVDRGDNRVLRVRNNGEKVLVAGTGFPKGPSSGGRPTRVSLPGASSLSYLPIGGYLISLEEGTRVWYVDNGSGNQQNAAPFVFGAPGVHQGDEEWFRAHGRRPKVGTVQSVTVAPSGDIILVEGNGFVRKIDFLRHKP